MSNWVLSKFNYMQICQWFPDFGNQPYNYFEIIIYLTALNLLYIWLVAINILVKIAWFNTVQILELPPKWLWVDIMHMRTDMVRALLRFVTISYGHVSRLRFVTVIHDDVIKWKHFPLYWPVVRGIYWSPVKSPHKGQWRGALTFSLICAWINGWVNNRKAGDKRRHRAHYDVIVMASLILGQSKIALSPITQPCRTWIKWIIWIRY